MISVQVFVSANLQSLKLQNLVRNQVESETELGFHNNYITTPISHISTVKGIQTQLKQLHFSSLETCLLSSAAATADPAITLSPFKVE